MDPNQTLLQLLQQCHQIKNIEPQTDRINPHASIYTAEAYAIDMALDIINRSSQLSFLVISDSLSCLLFLNQVNIVDPIILKLKLKFHYLSQKGKNIKLIWIPTVAILA